MMAALISQAGAKTTVDGDIGPKTISALNEINVELWQLRFCVARIARYSMLVERDRTQSKWFRGWVNRALGALE